MRRRAGTSLYAGFLFAVLGLIAWVSGQLFIFPSLGPSAFILAFATALIVSLGLLSTPVQVGVIVVSVVVLVEVHSPVLYLFRKIVGESHPLYRDE